MAQPGHTVNGCYKLQEKVGEDRFFTTWRATALYSPSSFSLTFLTFPYKDVPKRSFDEFRRLFLSLYTFQNPYVLTPFEYDESAETKYLASHWIRGYSLREAIDHGDFTLANCTLLENNFHFGKFYYRDQIQVPLKRTISLHRVIDSIAKSLSVPPPQLFHI